MNRKYIRLRRFLGISTILLGLLIAIIPTFSRAATVNLRIIKDPALYGYPGESFSATLADGKDGYGLNVYKNESDTNLALLGQLGEFASYAIVSMYLVDQDNARLSGDFGRISLYLSNPLEVSGGKPSFAIYYYDNSGQLRSVQFNYDENEVWFDMASEVLGQEYNGCPIGTLFFVDKEEEDPTDTPTPSPSNTPTAKPTAKPTTRPSAAATATPTPIPLRLAQIDDQRSDKSDTKGITAMVYGGSLPNLILVVRDSDGIGVKRIVVLRSGMKLKAWTLRLIDEQKRNVTDFKNLTVTLPIPASWDLKHGRVTMVGSRKDGKIKAFDTDIVDENGYKAAKFVIEEFTDHEYGMIYTPDGGDEDDKTLSISDNRDDKTGTEHISGSVTEGSGHRTLYITDSDSEVIRQRIVWKSGMLLDRYRIWIGDDDGNVIDEGFGVLSVTLPLSEEMDPSKGTIRVVGSTEDKATDDFLPEIIKNGDGTYSVRFSTDYFSDHEYGIVYTPYSAEPEATNTPTPTTVDTPTPTKAGTPTPTLSPTPYANQTNTPTPTKKPTGTPTPTRSSDPLITAVQTLTPTPLPPTGRDGRGPGSGPIVTPKGRGFTENGVSMNYATTGKNGGSSGGSSPCCRSCPETRIAAPWGSRSA